MEAAERERKEEGVEWIGDGGGGGGKSSCSSG